MIKLILTDNQMEGDHGTNFMTPPLKFRGGVFVLAVAKKVLSDFNKILPAHG